MAYDDQLVVLPYWENVAYVVNDAEIPLNQSLDIVSRQGWELVAVHKDTECKWILFLKRKRTGMAYMHKPKEFPPGPDLESKIIPTSTLEGGPR